VSVAPWYYLLSWGNFCHLGSDQACILFQVVFTVVDRAKQVQIALAVGPYGYSTLARIDRDH